MTTCVIPPDSAGYGAQGGNEVLSVKLDGGKSRKRQDILNSASVVDVTWIVGPEAYDYLCAFHRSIAKKGTVPFEIQLVLESSTPALHTVSFVPDTFKLSDQSGHKYTVTAQLEVDVPVYVEADDIDLVTDYNAANPL